MVCGQFLKYFDSQVTVKSSRPPGEPDLRRPNGALVLLGTKRCSPLELGEGGDVSASNPGWCCCRGCFETARSFPWVQLF